MHNSGKTNIFLGWVVVFFIFVIALLIQTNMYLNWQVCRFLDIAQRILQGDVFYRDFIMTQQPLIAYFYMPVVLAADWLKFNMDVALRFYVCLFAFGSIWVSHYFFQLLSHRHDSIIRALFLSSLSFSLVILPAHYFGTIENLVVILLMPYLMLSVLRQQKQSVAFYLAVLVGVAAGLAFALKPVYLLFYVIIEIYAYWRVRQLRYLVRTESLVMWGFLLVYAALVISFLPQYLTVLSMLIHFYWRAAASAWLLLLQQGLVFTILIVFLFWHGLRQRLHYPNLYHLLLLAAGAYLMVYLLIGYSSYRELIPMLSMITVLTCLLIPAFAGKLVQFGKTQTWQYNAKCAYLTVLLGLLIYFIPITIDRGIARFVQIRHSPYSAVNRITTYIQVNNYAGPIYFFATEPMTAALVVHYAGIDSASRFGSMWLLQGIVDYQKRHPGIHSSRLDDAKSFLMTAVAGDFARAVPNIVFMQKNSGIDYLKFFKQNPGFAMFWSGYHYRRTIHNYRIYLWRR